MPEFDDYIDPADEEIENLIDEADDYICHECDGEGTVDGHLCKSCQGSGLR